MSGGEGVGKGWGGVAWWYRSWLEMEESQEWRVGFVIAEIGVV